MLGVKSRRSSSSRKSCDWRYIWRLGDGPTELRESFLLIMVVDDIVR